MKKNSDIKTILEITSLKYLAKYESSENQFRDYLQKKILKINPQPTNEIVETIVNDMKDMLKAICLQEYVNVEDDVLVKFCETLNGDMRRAINELQASAFSKTSLSEKTKEFMNNYNEIIKMLNQKRKSDTLN